MLRELTIRGAAASLVWGSRTAAELSAWRIAKVEGQWCLAATIARVDRFQARQAPLLFTAPRPGGFWAWPIKSITVGESQLRAVLGPPVR